MPPFPVVAVGASPTALVAGYLELVLTMIRRFKLGPGYNHDIGVALGFESSAPSAPINASTVTPTIDAFAAASGAMFSCVVGNRADSDMWIVQILRAGDTTWENVGTFSGKSADVTITLTTPGQPEQIQVRVQLRKANANYGNVSDARYVTINP